MPGLVEADLFLGAGDRAFKDHEMVCDARLYRVEFAELHQIR